MDIYHEYSTSIFEDLDDIEPCYNQMIHENNECIVYNYIYDNFDDIYIETKEETSFDHNRNDYTYFIINRLKNLIHVFPNTNMEMLYTIAKLEWENMNNSI